MAEIDYLAYLLFCLAIQFTPGPNNIMLSYSGMNFGIRRSIPHIIGVGIGVPLLMLLIGLSIDWVLIYLPKFQEYLLYISIFLLLWLAYRLVQTPPPSAQGGTAKPLRFIESFAFQFVNPKSWSMILTTIGLFVTATDDSRSTQLYILVIMNIFLTFLSGSTWLLGGIVIRRVLKTDIHYRIFNVSAGIMLVSCAVYVLMSETQQYAQ